MATHDRKVTRIRSRYAMKLIAFSLRFGYDLPFLTNCPVFYKIQMERS